MIKAIIIDDNPSCQKTLQGAMALCDTPVEVIGVANSVSTGSEIIKLLDPDVVFLDINLGAENGFDLLESLMPVDFQIVFVTAYDEFVIQAIRAGAVDYIVKPFVIDDIQNALNTVASRIENSFNKNKHLFNAIAQYKSYWELEEKIALPSREGLRLVKKKEIEYCSADGGYCHVFFIDGSSFLLSKPLSFIEDQLNSKEFIRIHGSHLINRNYIKFYHKGSDRHVVLNSGAKLYVSNRGKAILIKALNI